MTDKRDNTSGTDESHANREDDKPDDARTAESRAAAASAGSGSEESLGITIPDDHVGAFVAQAFEDVERSTEWTEAVDAAIPADARGAWQSLSTRDQVIELLTLADEFDAKATALLEEIPLDRDGLDDDRYERVSDAKRLRRNADILRDGIAAGYAEGRVSDDELVAAIEAFGFDTATIAEREDALDAVSSAYNVEFRPYGGTLMTETEIETESGAPDDFEVM
ncbi:hypothetical protein [Natrialba taiwanensis]|uniref:Uncharacterized protein n=1 Tax=Natrialba taiwanensis DSM 12281 TaxID=1230458 RepID=M0ADD8_9EURY|nr:hypothetical protein [Natrialba taiwanensis]ELY96411.1 hypothetical protein C484_01815 [Natrialba taiwanensis DSM 12281]